MKLTLLAILPSLFLCSCGTYAGKDRVAVYSNCSHMKWTGGARPTLEMWDVNNSDPTRVGLDGITKAGVGIGTALLTRGVGNGITKVAK